MPVSSAPDMYVPQEGNPFQRILGRLKKQQGAEASAAEQVEEPEAMIGEDTPSMPAAPRRIPLPTEKEGKPFMMPSTEEPPAEDAGSAAEMLEGKPAMPDPEPGSLMDRTQPQKWQGRGGYNYSYAPPKGDKPATITIHQMGQGYSPVTISADGPKADAFSKILKEFTEIEGTEEHGAYEEFEPRRKRPTMQQAVESAAEELVPRPGPPDEEGEAIEASAPAAPSEQSPPSPRAPTPRPEPTDEEGEAIEAAAGPTPAPAEQPPSAGSDMRPDMQALYEQTTSPGMSEPPPAEPAEPAPPTSPVQTSEEVVPGAGPSRYQFALTAIREGNLDQAVNLANMMVRDDPEMKDLAQGIKNLVARKRQEQAVDTAVRSLSPTRSNLRTRAME